MSAVDVAATWRPGDLREARDAVRDAPGPLLFRGAGTKLDWGEPPDAVATAVDTRDLDDVVRFDPDDATATVGAGITVERLQAVLGERGLWLAIDPPLVEAGATLGGVLATGDAGPRRLRYGTIRDLVIGLTVVTGDGAVARAGGEVIKNVAGYDLCRLLCGSHGTLGLVTEVVVRLHPLPRSSVTVRIGDVGPPLATALTLELLATPLEPSAVDLAAGALWVRLEGEAAGVNARALAVAELAARHGRDHERLEGAAEAAAWRDLAAADVDATAADGAAVTVARAGTLPSRVEAVARAADEAAGTAGLTVTFTSHTAVGLHTARFAGPERGHAAAVDSWREQVTRLGGHVTVRRTTATGVDRWGPIPGVALMRRVKERFDPGRRCAPGRFGGAW